jgi:hypothetical protein
MTKQEAIERDLHQTDSVHIHDVNNYTYKMEIGTKRKNWN